MRSDVVRQEADHSSIPERLCNCETFDQKEPRRHDSSTCLMGAWRKAGRLMASPSTRRELMFTPSRLMGPSFGTSTPTAAIHCTFI
jgi:hypothetical protein